MLQHQVMMPEGAVGSRGAQKSALAGVLYDKRTDKQLGSLLQQLKAAAAELDPVQAAVVRDASRYERWGCSYGVCTVLHLWLVWCACKVL
jgi:Zn-dependent M32 family carboxypeptidase